MKVRITEDVTVETEVDVDVQDLLFECWSRIEEFNESGRRAVYGCIDTATKVLAKVPDCVLELAPPDAIDEVIRRLEVELARWKALKTRKESNGQ